MGSEMCIRDRVNTNSSIQNEEKQIEIKDQIQEGKSNNVVSEELITEPITEPLVLSKPVNTSSVKQNKEEQTNIIDEIVDENFNNAIFEKPIIEPKIPIPSFDQEQDDVQLEVSNIPTPQRRRKIDKRSEKNIFLAKKDYDKYSYDKAQQKYLEIINTGKDSKEAYEYLATVSYTHLTLPTILLV